MLWIIQGNLKKNEGIDELIACLKEKNLTYKLVKSIPFTDHIVENDVDINSLDEHSIQNFSLSCTNNVVTMGSYSLARAAIKKGWTPGAFINENFEYSKLVQGWGAENLLNHDAIEAEAGEIVIPSQWTHVFARPSEDNKFFAGQVFESSNFKYWLSQLEYSSHFDVLNKKTPIIISSVKTILAEYRLFVVDGKIVTGSLYKIKDKVVTSEILDPVALAFASSMLEKWQPDRAFVIDIAITDHGPKIIEVNNFNSSGFYKSNLGLIIDAIEAMK